jgi:hypothetical protein
VAAFKYNPPPGWVVPAEDWVPPDGWTPDPAWPPAPADWVFWIATPMSQVPLMPQAESSKPARLPPAEAQSTPEPSIGDTVVAGQVLQVAPGETRSADEIVELDDERVLQEVGIYRYHHPLENAEEFRDRLRTLDNEIKDTIKRGDAVLASDMFTFNNSLAKGRRMTSDFSKLMLRAYNAEADNCVRSLRAGNVLTAKKRLEASVTAIAKLGSMMEMRINPTYHELRNQELELTADFLMKVQEEKESAREERERLREERKAEQELALEREKLDKQRSHYMNALETLQASGDEKGIAELTQKLAEVDDAIARNDYRAANIKAGYVYVISNAGAFGENMVKIGMTRRLEPMDRVRELGDASVPFPFDVHALFFSDDAVALETDLHQVFAERRVNHVNQRREFYFASPAEVRVVLAERVGNLLEFTEEPEATQYRQSKGYWPNPG